jgi:hypothetical protein
VRSTSPSHAALGIDVELLTGVRSMFQVLGTRFVMGHLDAQVTDVIIAAVVTPTGQAEDVIVTSAALMRRVEAALGAQRDVAGQEARELNAKHLEPATLQRIAR